MENFGLFHHKQFHQEKKPVNLKKFLSKMFYSYRSLSDDEAPTNDHVNGAHVIFSTPVSSLKTPRNSVLKLKSTRFQLPPSEEKTRKNNSSILCTTRYINVSLSNQCSIHCLKTITTKSLILSY